MAKDTWQSSFLAWRRAILFSRIGTLLLVAAGAWGVLQARAQDQPVAPTSTTADLAFDVRARIAENERFTSRLQSTYFYVRSDQLFGAGQFVNLSGLDQYGAFRFYDANFETELRRCARGLGAPLAATSPILLKAGIIRVPFGIYDYRETYDSGIINYPLARSDFAYNGVDWSVTGLQATGSSGNIQVETALFDGIAAGTWKNYNGIDGSTTRIQLYAPPNVIVGVSGWLGHQAASLTSRTRQKVALGGIDLRYTRSHTIVRGEALAGTLAGDTTRGYYLDAYYRLPGIEKVSLVARIEALKPASNLPEARQTTVGARWNVSPDWTFCANYQTNNIRDAYTFTWTTADPGKGALLFQLIRRFSL